MKEIEHPKRDLLKRPAAVRANAASPARRFQPLLAAKFDHLWKRVSEFAAALQLFKPSPRRVTASAFAIALNAVLIAIVAASLNPPSSQGASELHFVLAPLAHAEVPAMPAPPDVALPVLQMPDIVIARETPDTAPPALPASLVLAPRPDPQHPNPGFTAGPGEQSLASGSVILRVLVSDSGSVVDAAVQKTSGTPELDRSAAAFVEAQWKFLPALLEGKPIPYWTTVVVRLS